MKKELKESIIIITTVTFTIIQLIFYIQYTLTANKSTTSQVTNVSEIIDEEVKFTTINDELKVLDNSYISDANYIGDRWKVKIVLVGNSDQITNSLNKLKNTLNDFLAVEEGKKLLERQRDEIIKKIRKELPYFIRRFTGIQRLSRKLGFKDIDLKDSYFPTYTFRCISKYGKITGAFDVVFDLKELEEFIKYLLQKIKFKKSVAGQRALMTPKLREKIKERDGYTCQICGLSNKDEQNLLLEIDHIIPLSKGGMTTEGNLQTLCWRCNRSKGAKI